MQSRILRSHGRLRYSASGTVRNGAGIVQKFGAAAEEVQGLIGEGLSGTRRIDATRKWHPGQTIAFAFGASAILWLVLLSPLIL